MYREMCENSFKDLFQSWAVMAYAFNPNFQEGEMGRSTK